MKPARKYLSGWRFSVIGCMLLGVSIFGLNLGVTIWGSTGFPVVKGVATVYEGSCSRTKSFMTSLHLAINILSTLLLGASNFCMQVLCAPTREEIDAAHTRRNWLSIGVPSLKNLFHIDRKKSALWLVLGLSSVPLHLLWNSAVVNTLSSNDYVFNAATEDFLRGAPWNTTSDLTQYPEVAQSLLEKFKDNSLVFMSVTDCIKAYELEFNSEYGNLILVYDTQVGNNSLRLQGLKSGNGLGARYRVAGRSMCSGGIVCDPGNPVRDNEGSVKYCLAEETNHPCRLGISPPILITVLICDAVKFICFVLTLCVGGSMHPLVTNGDAIESFLLRPDTSLKDRCLVSKVDVEKSKYFWSKQPLPLRWRSNRLRWAAGATKSCWLLTFIPAIILIITIIGICLANGVWAGGTATLVAGGFGKPSTSALVGKGGYSIQQSPTAASLLANTPQILVSYIYLAYNALFTYMLTIAEWVEYSVRPRNLRVAWPRGHQKARWFLQLPFTYGIPILVASTLLHWLISESLFLVRITVYNYDGTEAPERAISSTGYSPYSVIFAVSMGGVMLVSVLLLGFLKTYPATMPLAACCSASIAALCQPPNDMAEDDVTLEKLQWGVVDQGLVADDHKRVEHACFSTEKIGPLIRGRTYA